MGSHTEKNVKEKNKNKYKFSPLNSSQLYSIFWILLSISYMAQILKKKKKYKFYSIITKN